MAHVNITPSIGRGFAWQSANFWLNAHRRACIIAKFWARVQRPEAKVCWPFIGHVTAAGYGSFQFTEDGQHYRERAHRFSWLLSRGDIPRGKVICHKCDNPRCVNPSHLFLGSQADNIHDSVRKKRKNCWGHQKLNADQVQDIRGRCASGQRQIDVARAFGIARNTVSQIVNRRCWAHLPSVPAAMRQAS